MQNIEIDLEELKKNDEKELLSESFLKLYGSVIKMILKYMFGIKTVGPQSVIRGKSADIEAFARAIGGEKKYVEAAKKHGLDDPRTYRQKSALQQATRAFEKSTGIKWPFK